MKTTLLTMTDFNASSDINLRFRTASGTLRTSGYVVTDGQSATPYASLSKATEGQANYAPVDNSNDLFRLHTGND